MKRNPILFVLLVILIAQPLLSIGFGPTMTTNSLQPAEEVIPSQGTRLTPEEHTDHAPILIDGNSDFDSQGWPGNGDPLDPYVISGLNITYDIGTIAISVYNADASFVIQDCYLNQGSEVWALEFINTTSAVVEYTTIYGNGGGIYCDNANNTQILHSYVENYGNSGSTTYRAILMEYSESCSLEGTVFNATLDTCAVFSYSHGLELQGNTFASDGSSMVHMLFTACNSTSMNQDTVVYGGIGISFFSCFDLVITDIDMHDVIDGIYASNCPGMSLTGGSINTTTSEAVQLLGCSYATISGVTLEGPGNNNGLIYTTTSEWLTITNNTLSNSDFHGILISGAHNSTVNSNTIIDCSPNGILVGDSHDCEVSSNTISGSTVYGIEVTTSHRIVMDANNVSDVNTNGIYVEYSDEGTLSNSVIYDISNIGAYWDTCTGWSINHNTVSNASQGIALWGGSDTDVWSNDVSDIVDEGINVDNHGMLEAWENTVTNAICGFYMINSDWLYVRDNDVYGALYGMHIGSSVNHTVDNNNFYECVDRGLNLDSVDTSAFSGNQIFAGPLYGIYSVTSEQLSFSSNFLSECGFYFMMDASLSDVNHTFSGNTVNGLPVYYGLSTEDLIIDSSNYGQIILVNCSDVGITGGEFIKTSIALLLHSCEEVTISNIQISEQILGIGIISSANVTIENCRFNNIGDSAIYTIGSHNGTIIDSEVFNASVGFQLHFNSLYWNITNNHVMWCEYGLKANYADFMNLALNAIQNCGTGVYWYDTYDCFVYNNTIRWNEIGFEMESCSSGPIIYFNVFALNSIGNAFDDTSNNWDNWVDTGNYWDDYSGTGTYAINGTGGSVDNYPMQYIVTEPIINNPFDTLYAEGTTGHEVSWMVHDDYLQNYTVTIDGVHWTTDVVPDINNTEIIVNIDGLSYGEHIMVITVWDIDQNSVSDTVLIIVYDTTPPTIDNPPDFEITYRVLGSEITWTAGDLNPDNYIVWRNGLEFDSGLWTSGSVSVSLDGLSLGSHEFTMVVYDADENSASDTVLILVMNDDITPTIDSPEDIVFVIGTTGNRINWTPSDEHPDRYEITLTNDTVVATDSWDGDRIVLELDHLEVGQFNFTLTVWDLGDGSASDTVAVQVIPAEDSTDTETTDTTTTDTDSTDTSTTDTETTDTEPTDMNPVILGLAIVGGVVVVIAVVYFLKIKKSSS